MVKKVGKIGKDGIGVGKKIIGWKGRREGTMDLEDLEDLERDFE